MSQHKDSIEKILLLYRQPPETIEWARGYDTLDEVWQACASPGWMLWLLDTFGYAGERRLRLFAASCALRSAGLWKDPQAARAIDVATQAGGGNAGAPELYAAHVLTKRAAAAIVDRPDWSQALAAAAQAACWAVCDRAIDAANGAAAEAQRAVSWNVDDPKSASDEAAWQADELRRIVGGDIDGVIANMRVTTRGVLPLL